MDIEYCRNFSVGNFIVVLSLAGVCFFVFCFLFFFIFTCEIFKKEFGFSLC